MWVMSDAKISSAVEAERTWPRKETTLCATTGPMHRSKRRVRVAKLQGATVSLPRAASLAGTTRLDNQPQPLYGRPLRVRPRLEICNRALARLDRAHQLRETFHHEQQSKVDGEDDREPDE